MKKTRWLLIASAAAAAGITAAWLAGGKLRADERVSGLPSTKRVTYQLPPKGQFDNIHVRLGPAVAFVDGKLVGGNDIAAAKVLQSEVRKVWELRRTTLPKGASRQNTDAYSKELYWVPGWLFYGTNLDNPHEMLVSGSQPVDEFGRGAPGNYGNSDQDIWNQTLGGLLKNPLFQMVAVAALVASGPVGISAYGAYTMWQNRGKDLTLKNVALTAGRSYAAGQCGPPCAAAFDFGVGAASGKSLDRAAEDAALKEMTPQQQAQYRLGKQSVQKLGVT